MLAPRRSASGKRIMLRLAVILLLCLLLPSPALAEKRVALVVGNSAYQHTAKLANPKNDATDMVAALKKLGFQVLDGFDLDKPSFDRKVRDFAAALQGAQVGVFFFAGHGLQVAGHNYLVPIDAQLSTASALDFEMVRLDLVHRTMEREAQTNILFLDACRDNPLARNLARAMGTRSSEVGRGLAAVESGVGTLISFSTQPGNVALDGSGRNSPFAGALIKHAVASKDDLSAILIDVRNDVRKETQNKQVPWEHSALTGRFYFNATTPSAPASTPATSSQPRLTEAAEAWDRAKDLLSVPALEAFVRRFGDTYYGDLAKMRLAELKQAEAAKQAVEAAKKAEENAGAKAEAERQRLAMLQQEERKRAEAALATKPGRVFRDCADCPEMVVVPAGTFTMGSPVSEASRDANEGPQRKVTIARPFAVGRFAATFDQWDTCVAAGGCNGYRPDDQRWGRGRLPVISVSWKDAKAYAAWLSRETGKNYRLLSEAEREYVTRAGTTTPFWWGSSIMTNQANYDGRYTYGGSRTGSFPHRTVPVDSFEANPWGLHQLHGNVYEWTGDCWNDSYEGAPTDGSAWTTGECSNRVTRGGSWDRPPRELRAAYRRGFVADYRGNYLGFRLARTLD